MRRWLSLMLSSLLLARLLGACTSLPAQRFDGAMPTLDPIAYLTGPTRSWGVVETRGGQPKRRFRTAMSGVPEGSDALVLTQDFTFDDGSIQRRIWHIRREGMHRYIANADDVIGDAVGDAYGNAFHWQYTLQLEPRHPLSRVHMEHWMYLADGGETLLNRVVIRKFGLVVGGTTEYFRRGTGATAGIGGPAASNSP